MSQLSVKYDVVSLGWNDQVTRTSYLDVREARQLMDLMRASTGVLFVYMEEVSRGERHIRTTWMSVIR